MKSQTFDPKKLKKELKTHAKALGIPSGAANVFIDNVISSLDKPLSTKSIITEQDLKRLVVKELKKYHADFAYVYENHDKII